MRPVAAMKPSSGSGGGLVRRWVPLSDGPSQRRVSSGEATLIASSLLALTSGFLLRGIVDDHEHLDAIVRACSALVHLVDDETAAR
ncbi:hypothetical protein [Streptomyces jumonjinensis]|uniref:Uncharacterized protein n=1 Tax=Streptomyces jumonjinensis TaxID=1945 RepID=A0A646KPK4_STRJU|nr:hypothetical protein [Streptomyces jumonjinensis]MQT04249.1 hypothetical protein [Streptomyces jumonjinensis]